MDMLPTVPTLPMPEGGLPQKAATGRKLKAEGSHADAPDKKVTAGAMNATDVAMVASSPFAQPSTGASASVGASVGQGGLFGSAPQGGLSSTLSRFPPDAQQLLLQWQLNVGYRLRVLEACIMVVLCFPAASEVVKAMQLEGDKYHAATTGQAGHGLGAPGPYIWLGMMTGVISLLKSLEPAKQQMAAVMKLADMIVTLNTQYKDAKELRHVIKHCRRKPCRIATKTNVTMAVAPVLTEFIETLSNAMECIGIQRFWGIAPPSYTENKLAKLLKQMSA